MLVITALLAAGVAFILTPQQLRFYQALELHRAQVLAKPENRDFLTGAAYFREMDQRLAPDAKIFFSGLIGPNNRLYPYFFARTFLFPHEMEISLDHKADYQVDGFRGVDCSSPDELRTNGYDLMMKFGTNGSITTLPLTQKGVLKQ
jgi:hypothetical protein